MVNEDVTNAQQPTYGEYLVGKPFNPSNNRDVDEIKALAAAMIDKLNKFRSESNNPDANRNASLAITDFENGAMQAVKAFTKPEPNYIVVSKQ